MKLKFLIPILLLCIFNSNAQKTISGTVYSDTTMTKVVANVSIILKSPSASTIKKMKTDENGNFKLSLKNSYDQITVIIKKRGYVPITIQPLSTLRENAEINLKILLKVKHSLHDENYDGNSKVLSFTEL